MIDKPTVMRMRGGHLVAHYLLASLAYYHYNESPMTDEAFDHLCVRLDAEWDDITHPHKTVIERAALAAGSCFLKEADFPLRVQSALRRYIHSCRAGTMVAALEPHLLPPPPTASAARVRRRVRPGGAPVAATQQPSHAEPAAPVKRGVQCTRRVRPSPPAVHNTSPAVEVQKSLAVSQQNVSDMAQSRVLLRRRR